MSRVEPMPARYVLLVEDDPGIRALILAIVGRDAKMTIDCAHDGSHALALLRAKRQYAVILLDLMLPKRNGFEVLREMRSFAPDLLKRTIVITAASDLTLRDFDRSVVFALLRKPFDITGLLACIEACAPGATTAARQETAEPDVAAHSIIPD